MPLFEYRCGACGGLTSRLAAARDAPTALACGRCGASAKRIVSRPSVHLSQRSKASRMDPKYDAMVDRAMRNTASADPDRLVNRRGDIAKGRPEE